MTPEEDPSREPIAPQAGLFDIPQGARQARARVVLLTGPSGSGKTWLARRVGLPVLNLDDFYFDHDHPGLPHRHGIVDWDSPETWNSAAALDAIVSLARTGSTDVPIYDIPTSSRTGATRLDLADAPIFIAEGIFAAELVKQAKAEDVMADAICIVRPRAATFFFRLSRDLGEARKPPLTLIRRGLSHAREEPKKIAHDLALGCQPLTFSEAEQVVRAHVRQALLVRDSDS
ncbi:MAG: ATP-binding protein [bacterium]|nr:ATP-binding protein [bacterium]